MTPDEKSTRRNAAKGLVNQITSFVGHYEIPSASDPNIIYFVSKPDGKFVCTCSDFTIHSKDSSWWQCKHILAVIEIQNEELTAVRPHLIPGEEPSSPQSSAYLPSIAEKITMANDTLASWGAAAIDTDQKGYTGYGVQYVCDAVNLALGPDSWRYEILTHQVEKSGEKSYKAFVELQLYLCLPNGIWFTKGTQFGGSQNVDSTDALKGALSDGLKKAFSHWSIGNLAYKGELKPNRPPAAGDRHKDTEKKASPAEEITKPMPPEMEKALEQFLAAQNIPITQFTQWLTELGWLEIEVDGPSLSRLSRGKAVAIFNHPHDFVNRFTTWKQEQEF